MIKIICLGKIKEDYLNKMIEDYTKRISKYHKIQIIELKDENDLNIEKQSIEKYIGKQDYVVALDIKGEMIDSISLSKKIEDIFMQSGTITFIIGSSDGLHEDIKRRADYRLSFSKMTFPHGMFRAILLEQIYRSFKISNNEKYHK